MKRGEYVAAALLAAATALPGAVCLAAEPAERQSFPRQLSLDGAWEIIFDAGNEGREAGWHRGASFARAPGRRAIEVPSCWEEIEKDYEGIAYYRRVFDAPAQWEGKVVRLGFEAVNFQSEVWLNDQAVGQHEGGFTPFGFRVEKIVRAGRENTLTVRVAGPILMQDRRIEGVGKMETPQWRGAITGGIWQPVRLVATGEVYVEDVFIQPGIADNTVTLDLELEHSGSRRKAADLVVTIRPVDLSDRVVAEMKETLELAPGRTRRRLTLEIPGAEHWSPERPYLYRVEVVIGDVDGSVSDRFSARFGMREFTIRDGRFNLNGRRFYLKATFFEGLYPVKLAYPDSREMAVREIRLAKEAGFNMIRPWRKPPPSMWLDLADEMGVLTVGSLAIECMDLPVESARLPAWVENEVRETILRDRNRTCVVQWELFNELKRPVLKQMLHPMAMLARRLDPTRLILDESGGWARGANMYRPRESEPTKFNDIHDYPGQHINDEVYTKLTLAGRKSHEEMREMGLRGRLPGRNVVPGLMTFFSELGYGSLPDLVDNNARFERIGNPIVPPTIYHRRLAEEHVRALAQSGFDAIYPDLRQFCLDMQRIHGTANRRMIEAVRCNPRVRGYCIHALTAGDWIMGAGLLDLFRNPKTHAYEATRAANRPRIISIRIRPRNVYAERGARVEITAVNELEAVGGTTVVSVVGADGSVVHSRREDADLATGIVRLLSDDLDTSAWEGAYTVKAKVVAADGSLIAGSSQDFDVFSPRKLVPPGREISVFDPASALEPFLLDVGIDFVGFDSRTDRSLPVLVSRTVARTPDERARFGDLAAFVRSGGTAIYLGGGGPNVPWGKAGKASPLLPIEARLKRAMGHWTCIPRLVHDHPVFEGLPVDCMMGSIYENVWAQSTLLDLGGRPIVGTIGYDWYPDYDLSKRHYCGPGATWWGSDLGIVQLGQGRCVVSQLRLIENLGKDPVADRILFNLIEWVSG